MLVDPSGRELIVGAKRDRVFGTVLLVGAGGTNAELFHDRALELPPLSERLARRMLESLQVLAFTVRLSRSSGSQSRAFDRSADATVLSRRRLPRNRRTGR